MSSGGNGQGPAPHDFDCVCLQCQGAPVGKDEVKEKYLNSPCKSCGRKERRHKWVDKALLEKCWEQGIVATVCDKHHGEVKIALTRGYNVDKLKEELDELDPCDEEFMKEISQ